MKVSTDLPAGFADNMHNTLSADETAALCSSLLEEPETGVRFNPVKREAMARTPDELSKCKPVEWCPEGVRPEQRPLFTLMPELHAGGFYVQDPSSMIISEVVRRILGDDRTPIAYLDACAAPGGKTTAAMAVLPEGSLLLANEFIPSRAQILKENVQKWGYPGAVVTVGDTSKAGRLKNMFDIVAVDAPCSGEGMMRKDDEARRQWSAALIQQCASLQREILANVWDALKPGGHLIYSTCTFNRTENEEMVRWIMTEYGAEPVDLSLPSEWGIGKSIMSDIPALRFMPHLTRGEGLFLCVLRKADSECPDTTRHKPKKSKSSNKKCKTPESITTWLSGPEDYLLRKQNNNEWQAIPRTHADMLERIEQECTVIGAGIELCTEKGRDLIPSHGLALSTALADTAFPRVELDRTQALSFLRREAIVLPTDTPKGYVLVCHNSLPLGFMKNLGNRANNLYPQAWRIRNL